MVKSSTWMFSILVYDESLMQNNMIQTSTITEYDLGGEGDLFKAPEPIIEEPAVISSIDPIAAAAISLMSCGDDIIMPAEALKIGDMGPLQNGQLLSDVFYECKKDVEKAAVVLLPFPDAAKLPPLPEEDEIEEEDDNNLNLPPAPEEVCFQKSVSSGCLTSMEWVNGNPTNSVLPSFLDFSQLNNLRAAGYGMRRSFSEGDIETLGNGNISLVHVHSSSSSSSIQQPLVVIRSCCSSEDRLQKLSRYRSKKSRRNFGRKIKYACRKALADSQPRIRGRFARTEETDVKQQMSERDR
ncbi:hypothetical protein Dimus_028172 [Dionaea muscipula]